MALQPCTPITADPACAIAGPHAAPIVIVGMGPAGMRAAQEILRLKPEQPVVLYGDEPWDPYNRVQLSALFMGEVDLAAIGNRLRSSPDNQIIERNHCAVVALDREARTLLDAHGHVQPYAKLILALGSRPHIPNIPGLQRSGVYTFRDLNDVQRLSARRLRSRDTIVLGGGLLGLEAARALRRHGTEVCIVHHGPWLMNRQLDEPAARHLERHAATLGIQVYCAQSVARALGDERLSAVQLSSGEVLACDTLLLATGIRPNTGLALDAGIPIGRGIKVDDRLCTADPDVFAIGECAEHRGQVYGLVAPCLEQAAVAAHNVLGNEARYEGSIHATQLKVLGLSVYSAGRVGAEEAVTDFNSLCYEDAERGIYRKLVLRQGRLQGAISVGSWPEQRRIQEAILRRRIIWPWWRWRFLRHGQLWPDDADSIALWPTTATVCNCAGVSRGRLSAALSAGCTTVEQLCEQTGAGNVCGSCRPLLAQLVGASAPSTVARTAWPLGALALLSLLTASFLALGQPFPYSPTAVGAFKPEWLWSDGLWKQVSGYSLLVMALLGTTLSLRKRWKRAQRGAFSHWRAWHAALGLLSLGLLVAHTGLRFGQQLNFMLMVSYVALIILGGVAALAVAGETRPTRMSRAFRALSTYAHIVLLWPLPALLGFHILSVYYF